MELAFLVIYAAILGLVAPYLGIPTNRMGSLVPAAVSLASGSIIWAVLTWCGLHYDQGWIWVITMLAMPAIMVLGVRRLATSRAEAV